MGLLTGGLWFFLNSFFLYQLLEIGLGNKSKHKERILIFSILKFPVLYLIGFFILKSRFFPIYSLLLGLTLYFTAFGIVWMITYTKWNMNVRTTSQGDTLENKV